MNLREVLQARAAFRGRTAEVACGELGVLTVEALPLQEAEALSRGADADRAVFYAACRALQTEGDAMFRAGKLYAPNGVMQLVSDAEAAAAAEVVRELSGVRPVLPPDNAEELLPVTESAATTESVAVVGENAAAESNAADVEGVADTVSAEIADGEAPNPPAYEMPQEGQNLEPAQMNRREIRTAEEAAPVAEAELRNEEPADLSAEEEQMVEVAVISEAELTDSVERMTGSSRPVIRSKLPAADAAGGTEIVGLPRKTEEAEESLFRRQSLPRQRQPSSASVCDPEEIARQLLEGLRRAKWVRGV